MKRNLTTELLVIMSFLLLLVAAASSVVASPNFSSECGSAGCHETFSTLTLTTNSSVNAETGVPFVLQIDAGNGAEYVAIKSGWEDNDYFTISEPLVQDESTNDNNAADGEISVDVTFTPITNGTFTIRIWTAAGGDLARSFDVTVVVTGEPGTTTPTLPPTTVDLYEIWSMMMIWVPVAAGLILVVLGYLAIKRR
ncbi:MAG: hypothetical protein ACFFDQ_05400 [Candidatus Thorarchaeota archaeon]